MNLLKTIFVLCCITSTTTAQDLRKLEFSVYGQYPVRNVNYIPVSEAAIDAGETAQAPIEIKTHSLARVGPYKYTGGDFIAFRDTQTDVIVATVNLPRNSNQWLLIFVKNRNYDPAIEGSPKFLVYPFDDSLSNLPNNGLVFINISGKQLDGLLESKRVTFEAGESGSYRVQESLPVNLWTRDFSGDKLLPALIKTYSFEPDHRYLMIFFPPVLKGSVDLDVRFLSESTEKDNEAP